MRSMIIAAAVGLGVVSLAAVSSADTLILRDGSRVEGTVTGFAARTITFLHADGVSRRYPTSKVDSIEFVSADRANPRAVSKHSLEAPAGTELAVRTVEVIDSRSSGVDQTFAAIVEHDVKNAAGGTIVPRSASAQLVIRQLSNDGAARSPEMVLDIRSITVDGRRYLISPTDQAQESSTVRGTIVSAVPGGPGEQVLTRGRDVKVPVETVLNFRLDKPVALQ